MRFKAVKRADAKKVKLLDENQLVELVEADADATTAGEASMRQLLDRSLNANILRHGVAEDYLKKVEVKVNGQPSFVFWYHVDATGYCHLDAVGTIRSGGDPNSLPIAGEQIARRHGCKAITFHTARRGLVEIGRRHGYTPAAILMEKRL